MSESTTITYFGKWHKTWDGLPLCLFCDQPVEEPSMDGPGVCALCDMGIHKDGSKWTATEYVAFQEKAQQKLEAMEAP